MTNLLFRLTKKTGIMASTLSCFTFHSMTLTESAKQTAKFQENVRMVIKPESLAGGQEMLDLNIDWLGSPEICSLE